MFDVVNNTISSGLGANKAATPVTALASEDSHKFIAQPLVRAEHEADFTSASSNVTRFRTRLSMRSLRERTRPLTRHISVLSDVTGEFRHERDAEASYLVVRLPLWIEIGAALPAAHAETGESILEGLLEAEELEDGEVDGGVKTKAAFVRAECGVILKRWIVRDKDASTTRQLTCTR